METIAQPQNAEAVARLLRDPAVKAAIRDVSQEAALGMLRLAGDARGDVREFSDNVVRAVAPSLAAGVGNDLSPAFAGMVRRSTGAAFDEALSPENVERVRALGTAMTRDALRTIGDEAATALVPGVVSSLFASADAAAAEIDVARLGSAVGRMSHVAAHEAVLGANEGLRAALAEGGNRLFLTRIERDVARTLGWLRGLAIALGVLLVVATLSLAWLAYAFGRDRRALAQRDEAFALVMHVLRAADGRPWSAELRELLRDEVR
ncbi:MAG TPA: hypothetical protein VF339_03870 [Gammaproteobacteria bacterium]